MWIPTKHHIGLGAVQRKRHRQDRSREKIPNPTVQISFGGCSRTHDQASLSEDVSLTALKKCQVISVSATTFIYLVPIPKHGFFLTSLDFNNNTMGDCIARLCSLSSNLFTFIFDSQVQSPVENSDHGDKSSTCMILKSRLTAGCGHNPDIASALVLSV